MILVKKMNLIVVSEYFVEAYQVRASKRAIYFGEFFEAFVMVGVVYCN